MSRSDAKRLIIVSNRVARPKKHGAAAGGLAVGVPRPGPPPLVEATVDLRAINAALAFGAFDREHRAELLALEALRQHISPLLEATRRVAVSATATDRDELSVELHLGAQPPRLRPTKSTRRR